MLALVLIAAAVAWLIWAKHDPALGILLLIVGGGSALFVIGTARPS